LKLAQAEGLPRIKKRDIMYTKKKGHGNKWRRFIT